MIIYRCFNVTCPRIGQRTEKVCLATLGRYFKGEQLICGRTARKDYN